MNYLAHLLLSGSHLDRQVGGLLGDFVKGPLRGDYLLAIEQGITLHRQIDSLTARLPAITQLYSLFEPPWRRYAGIVIDIAFDHLLAQRWQHFHPTPLPEFCTTFYHHLAFHRQNLPERAQQFSDRAPRIGWLECYADPEMMGIILDRVGGRFRRPVELGQCWPLVQTHKQVFDQAFDNTMVELRAFSQAFIDAHPVNGCDSVDNSAGRQAALSLQTARQTHSDTAAMPLNTIPSYPGTHR